MSAGPLRALVLEDEWSARGYLVELLHESGLVTVVAAVASASQASEALDQEFAHVAFVDVNLAGSPHDDSGIRWVRSLTARARAPRVVLTTASERHAIEAFALGVEDYLLKPFTTERVTQCAQRLSLALSPSIAVAPAVRRIAARAGSRLVFLHLDEVWAFEASSRLTFVHTRRGKFDVDLSLTALEASLGNTLLRVHRNWLVRIESVASLERNSGETVLQLGDLDALVHVPVARDRTTVVRDALLDASVGLRKT
ncbi:MAG: LytTR family DNA-binding domain-containing protein [Deltaproteobacteria bacterium]|nr:LytTR family DNA-binding domain-containing protein [Deltaproteobacteria bacterium]